MKKFVLESVSIADDPKYAIVGGSRRFGYGVLGWYKDIVLAKHILRGLHIRLCRARIVDAKDYL